MTQKEVAVQFLQSITSGNVDGAFEQYVRSDFVHHNPYFRGDRESLKTALKDAAKNEPNTLYEIIHVLESEDTVAVHGRVIQAKTHTEISVVHILRFEEGKIVEEWETWCTAAIDSPNDHGLF